MQLSYCKTVYVGIIIRIAMYSRNNDNCILITIIKERARVCDKVNVTTRRREAASYSSDGDDDILISWDVKYILEDKREREQKRKKSTLRATRKERGVTVLRVSRVRVTWI